MVTLVASIPGIINNKKIDGILIETKNKNGAIYSVIRIGININQQEIPEELQSIASSLRIENSNPVQREPLLAFILNEFEKLYESNADEWVALWKEYCNHMNKKIIFHKDDALIEGHFMNIDNNGNAIINIDSKEMLISSGVLEIS